MYERMIRYIATVKSQYSMLEGVYKTFGPRLVVDVFALVDVLGSESDTVVHNFQKIQAKTNRFIFDFRLINYTKLFCKANVFKKKETKELSKLIKNLNEQGLRKMLIAKLPAFEKSLKKIAKGQAGSEYIVEEIMGVLMRLNEQLSIFSDTDES